MLTRAMVHRNRHRREIADQLLLALEDIVLRYRDPGTGHGVGHLDDLRAEAITTEVAHQLELARSALRRPASAPAGE